LVNVTIEREPKLVLENITKIIDSNVKKIPRLEFHVKAINLSSYVLFILIVIIISFILLTFKYKLLIINYFAYF
jgi:hypothetical protein